MFNNASSSSQSQYGSKLPLREVPSHHHHALWRVRRKCIVLRRFPTDLRFSLRLADSNDKTDQELLSYWRTLHSFHKLNTEPATVLHVYETGKTCKIARTRFLLLQEWSTITDLCDPNTGAPILSISTFCALHVYYRTSWKTFTQADFVQVKSSLRNLANPPISS